MGMFSGSILPKSKASFGLLLAPGMTGGVASGDVGFDTGLAYPVHKKTLSLGFRFQGSYYRTGARNQTLRSSSEGGRAFIAPEVHYEVPLRKRAVLTVRASSGLLYDERRTWSQQAWPDVWQKSSERLFLSGSALAIDYRTRDHLMISLGMRIAHNLDLTVPIIIGAQF